MLFKAESYLLNQIKYIKEAQIIFKENQTSAIKQNHPLLLDMQERGVSNNDVLSKLKNSLDHAIFSLSEVEDMIYGDDDHY